MKPGKKLVAVLASLLLAGMPYAQAAPAAQAVLGVPPVPNVKAAPHPGTGGPAFSGQTAGVAAGVRGMVTAKSPGGNSRTLKSGDPLFMGDEISTGSKSHLQVLLQDETVFTLGPASAITIDQFVFDPSSDEGKITAKIGKGVFRFVSGRIAHKDPKKVDIELPAGTIGIRGTMVAGKVDGTHSDVLLLGPGQERNTGDPVGKIIVSNEVDGKTEEVTITKSGFGTSLDEGMAPSAPEMKSPEEIAAVTDGLEAPAEEPESEGAGGGGASASEESGQDTQAGGESLESVGGVESLSDESGDDTKQAAQDLLETLEDLSGTTNQSNVTTIAALQALNNGYTTWSDGPKAFKDSAGNTIASSSLSLTLEINFMSEQIATSSSKFTGSISASLFTFNLSTRSFVSGANGEAIYNYTDVTNTAAGCSSLCSATADIRLIFQNDANGNPGRLLDYFLDVDTNGDTVNDAFGKVDDLGGTYTP